MPRLRSELSLPTIQGAISAAEEAVVELQADLAAGAGIGFEADVEADLILELNGYLELIAQFMTAFGLSSATAEVFTYSGAADEFGAACNGEVGSGVQGGAPTDQCQAVVIVTRYPAFIQALMGVLLKRSNL